VPGQNLASLDRGKTNFTHEPHPVFDPAGHGTVHHQSIYQMVKPTARLFGVNHNQTAARVQDAVLLSSAEFQKQSRPFEMARLQADSRIIDVIR
jgi:hypothetical protein